MGYGQAAQDWSIEFKGTRWQSVRNESLQLYQKNAYRVLLTRARPGMVIFVPEGDPTDMTRPPAYYSDTCCYLRSLGIDRLA